jgi:hypothetical protein
MKVEGSGVCICDISVRSKERPPEKEENGGSRNKKSIS